MTVLLGLSGGVDSGTAALLLREAGHEVRGCTLLVRPEDTDSVPAAKSLADFLHIPFSVLDVTQEFARTVMADFLAEYAAGRTPNPCVLCNKSIKFPSLLRRADAEGCDFIATGHYARIARSGSRLAVAKGKDPAKDQSYMLWRLPQETLARTLFPLGEYTKSEIRALAQEKGLPCARSKESQDICFIPDGKYTEFLAAHGNPLPAGTFTDTEGKTLGAAKNQACYTIGQRRGLGIACGQLMYVTAKDAERNRVVIAPKPPTVREVTAKNLNFMAGAAADFERPQSLTVRLRYTPKEFPCTAFLTDADTLQISLADETPAPAAGQSAVLYDGDVIVAGGIIGNEK